MSWVMIVVRLHTFGGNVPRSSIMSLRHCCEVKMLCTGSATCFADGIACATHCSTVPKQARKLSTGTQIQETSHASTLYHYTAQASHVTSNLPRLAWLCRDTYPNQHVGITVRALIYRWMDRDAAGVPQVPMHAVKQAVSVQTTLSEKFFAWIEGVL